jgi:hypothetical protein
MAATPIWAKPLIQTQRVPIIIPLQEGTTLTTGAKRSVVFGKSGKIVECRTYVTVAPATSTILVDVNKNGTTIYGTQGDRPIIAADATESGDGTPTAVVVTFDADDVISFDVDQVGTGTTGANLVARLDVIWDD